VEVQIQAFRRKYLQETNKPLSFICCGFHSTKHTKTARPVSIFCFKMQIPGQGNVQRFNIEKLLIY